MSNSQRWHKILKDTLHPKLSEQQIFWRSVALLRLGNHREALSTFEKLAAKQFSKTEYKLHAAELYLKNNLCTQGEQLLTESYTDIQAHPQHSKQWHFIAKRYPHPSHKLKSLLQRNQNFQQNESSTVFDNPLSWERGRLLKANHNKPEYYLAWLDWSLKNHVQENVIKRILDLTLQAIPNQSYLCYQIFRKLNKLNLWPHLIMKLFPLQHRNHAQPEMMWQQWWRACPNQYRDLLRQEMLETLKRHPNLKLEKLLEEFSQ